MSDADTILTSARERTTPIASVVTPRLIFISAGIVVLLAFPLVARPFALDIACQVFLAAIGALSLALLTGIAGQVSLGHAGLLAAGAFSVGILYHELAAPYWVTIPVAAMTGAVFGLVFGLPSLRLRGLYLAVSTLALHFVVVYIGGEYETLRSYSAGVVVDPPEAFGYTLQDSKSWYLVLLAAAAVAYWLCHNLLYSGTGRAWGALRSNETVAEALGIPVARYKLLAFVISSSMTAVAGALFAYYRGFVSIEAFSLYLSIQYIAMIIIGGMGSLLGALLGATFVVLMPYAIEAAALKIPNANQYIGSVFALIYASFGVVMIAFLMFEPHGLIGLLRRLISWRRRSTLQSRSTKP
ncbi:branched-chain amino acid ABC transporter permease [Pseudorhodoplanes sp.]|uniref:branched-chain amino acid ABC transporter permease n=1 Tax=Pseudorhodoplanes sp. TaxID=1934341 RepID=UPI003D0C37AB